MADESRFSIAAARALAEQVRELLASRESADVDISGSQVRVHKRGDGGLGMTVPGTDMTMRMITASPEPPADYPSGVPFIADEAVTVTEDARSCSLMWWAPTDPAAVLGAVVTDCETNGWSLDHESEITQIAVTNRVYSRGGSSRTLVLAGPAVMLIQKAESGEP